MKSILMGDFHNENSSAHKKERIYFRKIVENKDHEQLNSDKSRVGYKQFYNHEKGLYNQCFFINALKQMQSYYKLPILHLGEESDDDDLKSVSGSASSSDDEFLNIQWHDVPDDEDQQDTFTNSIAP